MKPGHKVLGILLSVMVFVLFLAGVASPPLAQAQSVQVLSANPPSADQGTVNLNVLIKGKGFKRGAIAKFLVTGTTDTGGVRVNSTTFVDATTLTANIDVSETAVLSKYDIQVMLGDGRGGKGTELFTVQKKGDTACAPSPLLTAPNACYGIGPGCLDTSYYSGDKVVSLYNHNVAIQSDDKIVAVGGIQSPDGTYNYGIVRYAADGHVDNSFGANGVVMLPLHPTIVGAQGVVIQPDGKIVVAGDGWWVVRLNSDGSLDQSFSAAGPTPGMTQIHFQYGYALTAAYDLARYPDGRIVVVGYEPSGAAKGRHSVGGGWSAVRLLPDGTLDPSFNPQGPIPGIKTLGINDNGANTTPKAVVIQRVWVGDTYEDRIVIGGSANSSDPNLIGDFTVVRLTTDGSALDPTFNPTGVTPGMTQTDFCRGSEKIQTLTLDADNRIVAAGFESSTHAFALARYSQTGEPDATLNGSGRVLTKINSSWDQAYGIFVQDSGKIVVSGIGVGSGPILVRYNPDGSLDNSFGGDGSGVVWVDVQAYSYHAATQSDGKIIRVGYRIWP